MRDHGIGIPLKNRITGNAQRIPALVSRYSVAWELCLVVALALAWCSYDLLRLPIWNDEATYLRRGVDAWARATPMSFFVSLTEDGKPPLFFWLVGAAAYLIPDQLLAGRVVTVLAGTASTIGIYLAGYWLAGRRVAVVSAILYAVVPFDLFFDRLAQLEGVLNMAGIWAFGLSVFIATRARRGGEAAIAGVGLGIMLGTALWIRTTGILMLAFPALAALLISRRESLRRALKGFAVGYSVLAVLVCLLASLPSASKMIGKTESFLIPLERELSLPLDTWVPNARAYWSWVEAYLPAPLWCIVLVAVVWGLWRRRRQTLLLVGCWAAYTLPPMLAARASQYTTRYVVPGVFPLLLLAAILAVAVWDSLPAMVSGRLLGTGAARPWRQIAAALLVLVMAGPSLGFDFRLLTSPESAPLAKTDLYHYVAAWPSGYGFMDALRVAEKRAAEVNRHGMPVIVLSDRAQGLAYDALRLYMGKMPGVRVYIGHINADHPREILAEWGAHRVPMLIVANQIGGELESFEREVPEAKRLGYFPKPTGRSSFRVYEIDFADIDY